MRFVFLLGISFFTGLTQAQECKNLWEYTFSTDPMESKFFTGDTSTVYAVLSYKPEPHLRLVLRGEFPKARFLSFETQSTQFSKNEDSLFDFQMQADSGSINPFLPGADMAAENRSYTVVARPDKEPEMNNTLRTASSGRTHSLMVRYFAPNAGVKVTKEDLPKVFAYDNRTGLERECPKYVDYPHVFYFPQFLVNIHTTLHPSIDFRPAPNTALGGFNSAIGYRYALAKLKKDEVILIRFRPPSHPENLSGFGLFSNDSQVRYWSVCSTNFLGNMTHNCLPDYRSQKDSDGFINLVYGKGASVEELASDLGYHYLPDIRESNQKVAMFVYRNLVPRSEFAQKDMFRGDYTPLIQRCLRGDFLSGNCRWR